MIARILHPSRGMNTCWMTAFLRWLPLHAGCLLFVLGLSGPLNAQDESLVGKATLVEGEREKPPEADVDDSDVEIVTARLKSKPGHRDVRRLERLRPGGGRLDWSAQGDWIAFDARDDDGLHDVYVSQVDGSKESCLTCENYDFRKLNVLDPVWHPSGDFLVVVVQESARKLKLSPAQLATPFRGLHSDLWVISRDGRVSYQITRIRENGGAVIDPIFSFEADRLIWSERLTNKTKPWGDWGVRVAEFKIRKSVPRLGAVKTYPSGGWRDFRAASALTPNDRGLLVAATLPAAAFDRGLDLFVVDLESGQLEALTSAPEWRDDQARYTPRGEHIVWTSNRGLDPSSAALPWRSDLWIMRAEAQPGVRRGQERLTFFNHPEADEALGEALIADHAWSPEGDRLLMYVISHRGGAVEEGLYLLTLDAAYRR